MANLPEADCDECGERKHRHLLEAPTFKTPDGDLGRRFLCPPCRKRLDLADHVDDRPRYRWHDMREMTARP